MPVHHEIDMVFLEHIEACLGPDRLRRAEQDVRDIGAHHGAAPAVGQGGAHGAEHDIVHFLVNAHRGPVQHLDAFAVDGPGGDAQLLPDLLAFLGRAAEIRQFAALLAELIEELERHLLGDFVHGLALDIDAEIAGHAVQFAHVLDLEILGFAASHCEQRVGQVPRMVGMGRGPGGNHTRKIPRRHDRKSCAAHAFGLFFLADEAAGPHMAHLAAGALMPDGTGLQLVRPGRMTVLSFFCPAIFSSTCAAGSTDFMFFFHNAFRNSFRKRRQCSLVFRPEHYTEYRKKNATESYKSRSWLQIY